MLAFFMHRYTAALRRSSSRWVSSSVRFSTTRPPKPMIETTTHVKGMMEEMKEGFGKRLDDMKEGFGKRLDDMVPRLLQQERNSLATLFFYISAAGGVFYKIEASNKDLDHKMEGKMEKIEGKMEQMNAATNATMNEEFKEINEKFNGLTKLLLERLPQAK